MHFPYVPVVTRKEIKNGIAKGNFIEIIECADWGDGNDYYKWMFSVILNENSPTPSGEFGKFDFCGIPNKCATKHQAYCRAYAKARQLLKGKYK